MSRPAPARNRTSRAGAGSSGIVIVLVLLLACPPAVAQRRQVGRTAVEQRASADSTRRSVDRAMDRSMARPLERPVTRSSRDESIADEVLRLINLEREKSDCTPLVLDSTLSAISTAHSRDMAEHRNLDHSGSDGRSPMQRTVDGGYSYRVMAENVAAGQRTAAEVVSAWVHSPAHHANIVNCSLQEMGIGWYRDPGDGSGEMYWTQLFATPLK